MSDTLSRKRVMIQFRSQHFYSLPFFLRCQRKKQSPSVRDPAFHVFGKREEQLGIGTRAMLPTTHAKENGSLMPSRKPAVFSTHASPLSPIAIDSEHLTSAFAGLNRNRRVRAGGEDSIEEFQFRCSGKISKYSASVEHQN